MRLEAPSEQRNLVSIIVTEIKMLFTNGKGGINSHDKCKSQFSQDRAPMAFLSRNGKQWHSVKFYFIKNKAKKHESSNFLH